jgi:hypothetical protein
MENANRDNMLKNSRPLTANMPYQSPGIDSMGQKAASTNQLYSNIQLDRSNPDILSQLKGNPYALNHRNAL